MTTTVREYMRQPVPEGGTCLLTFTLEDEAGAPVSLAALGTLEWTQRYDATGLVVATFTAASIKNTNGGTVHATNGTCTLTVPATANVLSVTNVPEWLVACLKWTYNGGASVGEKEIAYRVTNVLGV